MISNYKIEFDNFEFVDVEKLEIKKAIYQHTNLEIKSLIAEEKVADYQSYLNSEDPEVVVTCLENDRKILFKGIIEDYNISYQNYEYYLEFKAVSYSRLLERRQVDRIYHNEGTTYGDVFKIIEEDNSEFNILFGEDSLEDKEIVNEENPILLQYEENEWDFLCRIISYTGEILVVDDTKDKSETINILAGKHDASAEKLNNKKGSIVRKVDKEGNQYNYYKVEGYYHYDQLEEDSEFERPIFDVGSFVEYNVKNSTEDTKELVVIENRMYTEGGCLYSDLKLIDKNDYTVRKRERRNKIAGKSFRAEVKELKDNYTAQVEFMDVEDNFDSSKAHYYPLDRMYKGSYFSPEIGDVVEVYFKDEKEKYATIKSSSVDKDAGEDNAPEDKIIITPQGYKIGLNDDHILIKDKDEEAVFELTEDQIIEKYKENEIKIDGSEIYITNGDAEIEVTSSDLKFEADGRTVELSNSGVSFD